MSVNNKNVDRVGIIWGSEMRRVGLHKKTALKILRILNYQKKSVITNTCLAIEAIYKTDDKKCKHK